MVIGVWNWQYLQLFTILLRIMMSKEITEHHKIQKLERFSQLCVPLRLLISVLSASVRRSIYSSSCSWVSCHIVLTHKSLYCSRECSEKSY